MPYIANTPEAKLGRSDSLDPNTTCRGVTSSGRPCRRPLNASPSTSPAPSPLKVPKNKKSKLLCNNDPSDPDSYCWQHRDQAQLSAQSSPGPGKKPGPKLDHRASLDGLMDQLGIVEKKKRPRKDGRVSSGGQASPAPPPRRNTLRRSIFCCCFSIPIYEEAEEKPVRPSARPVQSAPAAVNASKPPSSQYLSPSTAGKSGRSSSAHSGKSQTSQYLQLIPPTVSPQTASQLMAELAKPISQQDEAGYIYIFWLTPESKSATPSADAARSLLAPPARPDGHQRRTSDVLQSFAKETAGSSKKTVLLKIGRASNVQRRLNEWTRQCGYNLSLIRYYPHIPSGQPSTPRKMPHSHKVERLIHIELAGAGLRVSDKGTCDACGKTHREWFEVEASRQGITMIDEVVKRWSDWDEGRS